MRALGIAANRHAVRVAQRNALHAGTGQVLQAARRGRGLRRHHHPQRVHREHLARAGRQQVLLLGLVHGGFIGRRKHVHRRAAADLLQQHARGSEVEIDLGSRVCLLVGGAQFTEALGQARCRRHRQVGRPGRHRGQQSQQQQSRSFHGRLPARFSSDRIRQPPPAPPGARAATAGSRAASPR
ncbi:hypothetical protein G6F68_015569 [Rhizopus microsporus]|nr:hypothetical protein G6F68_015569 [Rhizopus microsporus]